MTVWIDQDLHRRRPVRGELSTRLRPGSPPWLACVKEGGRVLGGSAGHDGLAAFPAEHDDAVREAAEECPGECIFLEE